jgi:hypothetical protein
MQRGNRLARPLIDLKNELTVYVAANNFKTILVIQPYKSYTTILIPANP